MTMTTARRSAAKRLLQISKRERFAQPKSAQRRSASTLRHESAFLARQQLRASRAVIHRISLLEGKAKDAADEIATHDRATSSHLHERPSQVRDNCSSHHTRPSLGLFTYRGERMAEVDQGVGREHPICRRSLYENLEGPQEVEAEGSQAEATTARWPGLHEKLAT